MRFSGPGDKHVTYTRVDKTLKKLIESDCINQAGLSSAKFGGQITTECTRYWNDFSLDTSFEIKLFQNGIQKDLELNEYVFSFIVRGHESRTNSSGYSNEFTIIGCNPKGDEFEFSVPLIRQTSKIVNIIYALIVLAETPSIDEAHEIWDLLSQKYYISNPSKRLNLIINGEKFANKILEKYPFMTQVIKNALNFHITEVKEELKNLPFLK